MLTALREDGTPFQFLPRLSKEALKKRKKVGPYYCPECKEKVMMKIGTQRMEHFAHQPGSQCVESYERESSFHLNGKMQLFHWLESQKLHPKLEPYYESLKQRPDISVKCRGEEYAVEFQCSTIPPQLMIKRTNTYRKNGIKCVWILGSKQIKRKSEKKVSLSKFDYLFLNKTPCGKWYLPYYCSNTKRFVFLTNIVPVSSKNALTQFLIVPNPHCSLQQLITPTKNHFLYAQDWKNELRAQKMSIALKGQSHLEFLREMYLHHLNISLLPTIIGLPIHNAPFIETSPLIWQTYLYMDLFKNKRMDETITFNDVYRCFMQRVQREHIKLRTLPLIENTSTTLPLVEYLQLLVQLQVLEAKGCNTYRMKKDIVVNDHFVAGQKLEEQFYKEYQHLIFQNK